MNAKVAIALIMGLVFQAAQLLPGMWAPMACAPVAEACDCGCGGDSCPCADRGEPAPDPLPVLPDNGSPGKTPLAPPAGTRVEVVSKPLRAQTSALPALAEQGIQSGYAGVRLSVSFCRFVI